MTIERLTTLAAVKEWLKIEGTTGDAQLLRLIDGASRFVLNWLDRSSFRVQSYTQNFRGNGRGSQLLYNWPVVAVSSVGVGGSLILASTLGTGGLPGSGYTVGDTRMGPQSLDLHGHNFFYGAPSQVVYTAGYRTTDTSVLTASPWTVTPASDGQWSLDIGVTLNGVAATKVTGTPTTGQYAVSEWGVYTFAAADVGKTVVITYDYVPWDVSWAVTELIGEWYRRKDRIGILSKTLGGQETVTFSQKDMGDTIRASLQPYANVVPV